MSFPIFRTLIGVADGINKNFQTPTNYQTGSVKIFRNGMLLRASLDDGWTELGGDEILLKEAPKETDVIQAYYISNT